MGDALVSSLVSGLVAEVVRKLTSIVIQEIGLHLRLKDDIQALKDDFNKIQAVLHDAEEKQTKEEVVKLWLKSLKYASLDVENVLDEMSTEALLHKLPIQRDIKHRVRAFFSFDHNHLIFRTRIVHKVKRIRIKLDAIAAKRFDLNLTPGCIQEIRVRGGMPNRETSSLLHSTNIFGRNKEMEMVVEKICDKNLGKHDNDNIRVYAIWGMGGLGKTTLAQLVYNHEKVNKYFELKCWRYVSEYFQAKEIIKGLIESIDKTKCKLSQLDDLQLDLQEKVQEKRFLVVLDDVWIEESEKSEWDKLCITLNSGAKGSIILVTTRNQTTSRMILQVHELQHELRCLSNADSWSLFEKLSFAQGREGGDRRELEPIGKKIVKKCKGLPLAVKTLGGMMWSKSSTREWELVRDNNIWDLQQNDILPALKLSYDNLLPHLKRCFSYCCLFPKGYEMEKDLLILLWMANGFIPPRGDTHWYLLGEEIYNCLVWRSFFQVVDGEYKMHDLMHDMAQYVMGDDCMVIQPDKKSITREDVLHLSFSWDDFVTFEADLEKMRSLRSIFIFGEYTLDEYSFRCIFDLVYLRVLCLRRIKNESLPVAVGKLKYLKYLNLSGADIEELPDSIIYLQNLKVLILELCGKLVKLPEDMRYMKTLQHLNIKHCDSLECLPVGILKAVNDVRLTEFPVGKKKGAQIREVGDIINLDEGKLVIKGLENVEGGLSEAKKANLKSKTNLLNLILSWGNWMDDDMERISGDEEVLEGLEPNSSLEKLEIIGYNGKSLSSNWIVNLNNLVKISFNYCKNLENIPPFGKLLSLRVIWLYDMSCLKCFHDEDYNTSNKSGDNTTTTLFPSLQEFQIVECASLVSLPSYFPKLRYLHMSSCKSLLSLPDEIRSFKHLNRLTIFNCENLRRRYDKEIGGVDWQKISHIPYITIRR